MSIFTEVENIMNSNHIIDLLIGCNEDQRFFKI